MTAEELRKSNSIFDVMAVCCKYLLDKLEKEGLSIWNLDGYKYDNIYDMVEKYTYNVIEKGHAVSIKILIKDIINEITHDTSPDVLWAIVTSIDSLVVEKIDRNRIFEGSYFFSYKTLNDILDDEIRIIPKINDSILLKNGEYILKDPNNENYSLLRERTECYCSKIDEATTNYMIWDKERLNKYPLTIYHIKHNSSIAKHFRDRKQLRIGIVPLSSKKLDDILDIRYGESTFNIQGMKPNLKTEIEKRYLEAYKKSIGKDIDFLIYPEMLITEDIIDAVYKEIHHVENGPVFIINGSIWKERTNKSIVTDGHGKHIFTYFKKCAFNYKVQEKEYKEDLNYSVNKEYAILEIDEIGRIGIGICKDIRDPNVMLFHQYIDTDILLVPAFSNSLVLASNAQNMAENFNCLTVFANSCAACAEKWKELTNHNIGFLTMPAKKQTESDCFTKKYNANNCYKTCQDKCSIKIFTLTFDDLKFYDDKVSIKLDADSF